MLAYGTSNVIEELGDGWKVYNLTSYREGLLTLNYLIPNLELIRNLDGPTFDMMYFNYIMSNDQVFYQFFGEIIMNLYNGLDVYLVINNDDYSEMFAETLMKIIQQRYGHTCYYFRMGLDVMSSKMRTNYQGFQPWALPTLDQDKERYAYLSVKQTGG